MIYAFCVIVYYFLGNQGKVIDNGAILSKKVFTFCLFNAE